MGWGKAETQRQMARFEITTPWLSGAGEALLRVRPRGLDTKLIEFTRPVTISWTDWRDFCNGVEKLCSPPRPRKKKKKKRG